MNICRANKKPKKYQNPLSHGNKQETTQLINQIRTVFTEGYFRNLKKTMDDTDSGFMDSNIREIQHLMIQLPVT